MYEAQTSGSTHRGLSTTTQKLTRSTQQSPFSEADESFIKKSPSYAGLVKDSSVGIATTYGLIGPGSIPGRVGFLSFQQSPGCSCDPPSLISNGYRGRFQEGKVAGA
jgi:hypothetical protein